jgi:3-deoxy-7-phosphoheptulonate synthase
MILILKKGILKDEVEALKDEIISKGFTPHVSKGDELTIIGLVGDTTMLQDGFNLSDERVERIVRIQEPYKKVNKMFKSGNTVVDIAGCKIGGGNFAVIAGPCSVETREQMVETALGVKKAGADLLRGGAFKPRTSPYSFQGLGEGGIELLLEAKRETGLPIVTEIMSVKQLEEHAEDIDMIQIGARNMQNYELLKAVGSIDKPVLLKRGMSATIKDFLMAAEYIAAEGNENIVLCERGIRTFENATRNTLDISAIPVLKRKTHLPVIVDPSHSGGYWWLVEPLALAAIAAGADGLMIEVHRSPKDALCDGEQSLKPERFEALMASIRNLEAFRRGGFSA